MPYAMNFEGHGVYTPDGKTNDLQPQDIDEYNKAVETAELAQWAKQPEHWQVYIVPNPKYDPNALGSFVETQYIAQTFLGTILAHRVSTNSLRTYLGRNMVAVSVRGTNGANYHGRYGADSSQLWRVRKTKA